MNATNKLKGATPYKPMPVPKRWFPLIEYALGIKLTPIQKYKLFYPGTSIMGDARSGKTLVHCISVALSIGPPLHVEIASDYGDGTTQYKYSHFMNMYRDIAVKLESAGFNVRQVGDVGGWKILRW